MFLRMVEAETINDFNKEIAWERKGNKCRSIELAQYVSTLAVQWHRVLLPHSARNPGSILALGYCLCEFRPASAWVSSGCSGFLPQSKDVQVRWVGRAKLPLRA